MANHAEAGPGNSIPETTARDPLHYDANVDDEMTTFYMENHYHCVERDDWDEFQVRARAPPVSRALRRLALVLCSRMLPCLFPVTPSLPLRLFRDAALPALTALSLAWRWAVRLLLAVGHGRHSFQGRVLNAVL